jgi:hypothetical protein
MHGNAYIAMRSPWATLLMMNCMLPVGAAGPAADFTLQTRDRETRRTVARKEAIDPAKIGIVIIDMWNTNDCMTNAQRAAALVPRMNKVLEVARRLGMQIIWYAITLEQSPKVVTCPHSGHSALSCPSSMKVLAAGGTQIVNSLCSIELARLRSASGSLSPVPTRSARRA